MSQTTSTTKDADEDRLEAFAGLLVVFLMILSLVTACAYITINGYPPTGFITGQEVILSNADDTHNDPDRDRAKRMYQPGDAGHITYCEPDAYGRPTCAYGLLTQANIQTGANYQRSEITIDPTGWPKHNDEWLKTPLISPALGGDIQKNTLIPTTRLFHKNLDQIEQEVKDYLDNPGNAGCPLYYAVTPTYTDDELIPRVVTVDIESCDHVLSKHHTLYNVMYFWSTQNAINYHTGEIWNR